MIFTGTYQRSIDSKQRVALPKRLRASADAGTTLFLTPGVDHCLELHTSESLNDLALEARRSQAGSKNLRSFSRLFYARAQQADMDKQGRIRIPNTLAQLAQIEKEVVFIGVGFHWELWDGQRWQAYLEENHETFDQIAESLLDGAVATGDGDTQSMQMGMVKPK